MNFLHKLVSCAGLSLLVSGCSLSSRNNPEISVGNKPLTQLTKIKLVTCSGLLEGKFIKKYGDIPATTDVVVDILFHIEPYINQDTENEYFAKYISYKHPSRIKITPEGRSTIEFPLKFVHVNNDPSRINAVLIGVLGKEQRSPPPEIGGEVQEASPQMRITYDGNNHLKGVDIPIRRDEWGPLQKPVYLSLKSAGTVHSVIEMNLTPNNELPLGCTKA